MRMSRCIYLKNHHHLVRRNMDASMNDASMRDMRTRDTFRGSVAMTANPPSTVLIPAEAAMFLTMAALFFLRRLSFGSDAVVPLPHTRNINAAPSTAWNIMLTTRAE